MYAVIDVQNLANSKHRPMYAVIDLQNLAQGGTYYKTNGCDPKGTCKCPVHLKVVTDLAHNL